MGSEAQRFHIDGYFANYNRCGGLSADSSVRQVLGIESLGA